MSLLTLLRANLTRRRARTAFTFLSILVAFVLYGYLSAIDLAFSLGVDVTGEDRLITVDKVSIVRPLPISYLGKLEATEGVVDVAYATWFGGVYQDPMNFFPQMAVGPERFLRLYPEYVLPDEQKRAWFDDRIGAIAGRKTAERFGWKIGDRIPIQGTIWRKKDGGATWEFVLDGIYEGAEPGVDETQFLFHYDYFDESQQLGPGLVGWYIVRVGDPANAARVAERIDRQFANSRYETKTTTEKAWVQAFAKQIGDIGKILSAVMTAVFFTILLVAGNTMAQSVRERTSELAVMKTLGFSNGLILGMVIGESLLLAGVAGALGLAIAWLMIDLGGDPTGGFLAIFRFPPADVLEGVGLVLLLGVAAGILPAWRAMRLRIVDALRRV